MSNARHRRCTPTIAVAAILLLAGPTAAQSIFESRSVADTGSQPSDAAVHGGRLVVTNLGDNALQSFAIDRECTIGTSVSVPTGTAPLAIASGASGSRLYVTLFSDDRLGVFDAGRGSLDEMAGYATGQGPVDVAVSRGRVFVSNVFGGTISVFGETETGLELVDTLEVGGDPGAMTVDSSGRFLFIADERRPLIETFRIGDGGGVRSVSRYLMQAPAEELIAHPSGAMLFATQGAANRILALGVGGFGQLELVATAAFEGVEERHDELGGLGRTAPFPGALAYDAADGILFVAGRETADVHAYRVQDGLDPLGSYPAFEYPEDLVFDAVNRCLYVISSAYGQILGMKVNE